MLLSSSDNSQSADEYLLLVEAAFRNYADMVFALAYSRCAANYSDAQDVTSEVFLRLMRRKPTIKSDEHMKAWLLHVTINCSKSILTNAWHRHTVAIPHHIACAMDEDCSIVYDAVMGLPLKLRTAIHLFYYEDYSVEQIAITMRSNPNTVKSWLKRGRDELRKILKDEEF